MPIRYVDFIHSQERMEKVCGVLQTYSGMEVEAISARGDVSGPKDQAAIDTFSRGACDVGRL